MLQHKLCAVLCAGLIFGFSKLNEQSTEPIEYTRNPSDIDPTDLLSHPDRKEHEVETFVRTGHVSKLGSMDLPSFSDLREQIPIILDHITEGCDIDSADSSPPFISTEENIGCLNEPFASLVNTLTQCLFEVPGHSVVESLIISDLTGRRVKVTAKTVLNEISQMMQKYFLDGVI